MCRGRETGGFGRLLLMLALAGIALCAHATLPAAAQAGSPATLARVRLDISARGRPLPNSFLGFSQEYDQLLAWSGIPATGVDTPLVNLFATLTSAGSGPPLIRVGGGTTDGSWFNPTRDPRPPGIYYSIDDTWLAGLRTFVQRTGSPVILGLNFALRRLDIAVNWARAALSQLPPQAIRGFEVGNEPDFYSTRPLNPGASHPRPTRSATYGPRAYIREAAPFLARLHRALPTAKLFGPGLCCAIKWIQAMPEILKKLHSYLSLVTLHRYPLHSCGLRPGQRGYPTPSDLLSPTPLIFNGVQFYGQVKLARQFHLGLRETEVNSVACGGALGTSNTFASALWAANWAFAMDAVGVAGVDFHGASPLYKPFTLIWNTQAWLGVVNPEFYGLLLFSQATADHAQLLPRSREVYLRRGLNLWDYSFLDPVKHEVRTALLNMDPHASGTAVLDAGSGFGSTATVRRLTARSLRSQSGITWAGQHYAAPTADGRLIGSPQLETIHRVRRQFRVAIAPASAILVTIPYRGR
jgi:hypothetical protein